MKKREKRTTKRKNKRNKDLSPKDATAVKGGTIIVERKAGKGQQEYY